MPDALDRPIPASELEAVDQQLDALEAKLRELEARLAALQRPRAEPATPASRGI